MMIVLFDEEQRKLGRKSLHIKICFSVLVVFSSNPHLLHLKSTGEYRKKP